MNASNPIPGCSATGWTGCLSKLMSADVPKNPTTPKHDENNSLCTIKRQLIQLLTEKTIAFRNTKHGCKGFLGMKKRKWG